MESILQSIKTLFGGAIAECADFDQDIIMNINSSLSILHQLGIGPARGFKIESSAETWDEFLGEDVDYMEDAKIYIYMKARLVFDPPTNSFLTKSFEDQIKELEWRLNVAKETPAIKED